VDSSDPYPSSMVQPAFIFVSLSPPSIFSPIANSVPHSANLFRPPPSPRSGPRHAVRCGEPQPTAHREELSPRALRRAFSQLAYVSVSLLTYLLACLRIGQLHRQPCFATRNLMSIYNQLFTHFSTLVISCSEQDQMSNLVYVHHPY
jgi:hypothetical protein